ncbi:MAG: fimbria/pilus outer membrane usher protein [Sphingopyxis sp.]|nr:fimbria/pilus outer membrane usher protein [Sphingopyxis sp.]
MARATFPPGHLRWVPAFVAALCSSTAVHAANDAAHFSGYSDLPPPMQRGEITRLSAEQRLELELVVNGLQTGIVAAVVKREGRFQLRAADLYRAGMLFEAAGETLFLDSLDGVRADYDMPSQRLHLTVSPEYLPAQRIGQNAGAFRPAKYDMGALLNYDAYVSGGDKTRVQGSLWHEARLFGPAGIFSTTGALRTGGAKTYIRFDTHWRWSDERSMTTIEAGDIITRTLPYAPAVRLGGIQLSRDFSVRPDVITYPLPEFAGNAALPSTVDLVVDGQRIAGSRVNPGPFALGTLPPISGYGEANLIVTDMHGRSVATAMPFYVSSALLRPGLTDYSVAAGAFRRNYGIRNFDYGRLAASASARHGVTRGVTLEVRAEVADDMRLAGGGAVVKLGHFGTMSAAYSRSFRDDSSGGQFDVGYDYLARGFSIGLRHRRRDSGYFDLGLLDRGSRVGWERLSSATASLSLGGAGTLGVGYFDLRQESGRDARLTNLSWSIPLWRESRLYTSLSRDFVGRAWSGALTLSMPLGGGMLSAGAAQDYGGRTRLRADYSRSVPSEGGVGWNASAISEDGQSPYLRGDMIWRTQPVQLRAGAYGQRDVNGWVGASGSLVFMDGALFAANRVTDAFAVVSTGGEAGVPVRYENQLIGVTNKNGHLLVPSASAYYPARYDIDTLDLPATVMAPVVSQRVAIAAGSGHVIRFPVTHRATARATLRDAAGAVIPAGTAVTINAVQSTYVGWDGLLFIEQVAADNRIEVSLPGGGTCRADFVADPQADDIIELGNMTCRP